jgi:hypothetical protein
MLAANSGLPFRLGRWRYHKAVVKTDLPADELDADERLWLYRPMARPDTMEALIRMLTAHGHHDAAAALANGLPRAMRAMRLADVLPETNAV